MKNLRTQFDRFCLKHHDKGIPNLMLYIVIGSAIVYIMSMIKGGSFLYEFLRFDKAAILRGQVWRLFTYVLTYSPASSPFLILIAFYFFYMLSRSVESRLGTLRFNLFYFTGVVMMDIFAMIFCPVADVTIQGQIYPASLFSYSIYGDMGFYLHLSILLMFASCSPDAQFLVLFFIPVKAWFLGLVYLVLITIDIINLSAFFPHCLFPLVGLLNYLLFAGSDVRNLFPFMQQHAPRQKKPVGAPIPFRKQEPAKPDYHHRCAVCGRTDISDPQLEFRYCSRCNGYYCYCQDHINDHTHIQ